MNDLILKVWGKNIELPKLPANIQKMTRDLQADRGTSFYRTSSVSEHVRRLFEFYDKIKAVHPQIPVGYWKKTNSRFSAFSAFQVSSGGILTVSFSLDAGFPSEEQYCYAYLQGSGQDLIDARVRCQAVSLPLTAPESFRYDPNIAREFGTNIPDSFLPGFEVPKECLPEVKKS